MCCSNCIFVLASLMLTLTFITVGISFFGPYWLSNVGMAVNETSYAEPQGESYLPHNKKVWQYPDRGLWAQCGHACVWFWTEDFYLQKRLFTPLQWHLSTQVLYFIGAFMILICEVYARAQLCSSEERTTCNYAIIGVLVLISAAVQTSALAAFGVGTSNHPYQAITDPTQFTQHLGQAFDDGDHPLTKPYLGWCYWMAMVGDMASVLVGIMFLLAAFCKCCSKRVE